MAADQAGPERQEVPLAAGRVQHILGIDAEPIEDQRQLVDQGDVDVALDVLDHLGGFGHADRRCRPRACGDDALVQGIDHRGDLGRRAGGDLADVRQPPLAVARVDPLRAVTAIEILVEAQPRPFLEQGDADFLGGTGIDRGFIDHDVAALEQAGNQGTGAAQRRQIGLLMRIDRGRHGHDVHIARGQIGGIGAVTRMHSGSELIGLQFQRVIQATLQLGDPRGIDVVAYRGLLPAEGHRQRQPDIAEPDDADARRGRGGNGLGHRSAPHRGTGPASRRGVIRGYVMRYGAGIQVMQA